MITNAHVTDILKPKATFVLMLKIFLRQIGLTEIKLSNNLSVLVSWGWTCIHPHGNAKSSLVKCGNFVKMQRNCIKPYRIKKEGSI